MIGAVIGGLIGGLIFSGVCLYVALRMHYDWNRRNNNSVLLEAEDKLKRALYKVEEESSKFAKESQNVRKKLFDYE